MGFNSRTNIFNHCEVLTRHDATETCRGGNTPVSCGGGGSAQRGPEPELDNEQEKEKKTKNIKGY